MADRVWTPLELVRWTTDYLTQRGLSEPRLEAEHLLADTLGLKRLDLYLQFERPLAPDELAAFKSRLLRRAKREPLQYIAGFTEFRSLRLRVDGRVLIPRPETEQLVERVLEWSRGREGLQALDIGTGSGAIALSLALEGPFARVVATDISPDALEVARANREAWPGTDAVTFRAGADFEPVAGERFDVVVSNPPYIGEEERPSLQPEVRDWEPREALFAEGGGLAVIERLIAGAPEHLVPGGLFALEIGAGQGVAVAERLGAAGAFEDIRIESDYAGRDRMVLARRA